MNSNQPYRNATMDISDPSSPSVDGDFTKGEQQPRKFNDIFFGILLNIALDG